MIAGERVVGVGWLGVRNRYVYNYIYICMLYTYINTYIYINIDINTWPYAIENLKLLLNMYIQAKYIHDFYIIYIVFWLKKDD